MKCSSRRLCLLKNGILFVLALLCLLFCVSPGGSRNVQDPAMAVIRTGGIRLADGDAEIVERAREGDGYTVRSKYYYLPDGCLTLAGSFCPVKKTEEVVFSAECREGTLRWYSGGEWTELSLAAGIYQASCMFLDTDSGNYVIYMPKAYEDIENGSVRYIPGYDGRLFVRETGDGGFRVDVTAQGYGGTHSDFFLSRTDGPVLNWDNKNNRGFWKTYANDGDGRMLYGNYYFISEATYVPTGADVYSNCPACYLGKSFVHGASYYPAMRGLAVFILDTMMQAQNAEGFWPSLSLSLWLQQDYGIGADYYDTRFNSDLAEVFLAAYESMGGEEFKDALGRYMDFYLELAAEQGWSPGEGLFVPDYYKPGMTKPHTALNHQLAEMSVLYKCGRLLDRPELTELADSMLAAVECTADGWIMPDGDLEYGIFPDGHFGLEDYPYLTYNDLSDMQALLESMGRGRSAGLQKLMDSKKLWMDRNGVTDYKKE